VAPPTDLFCLTPANSETLFPVRTCADRVRLWTSEAFAKTTQRAYRTDWTHFADWCDTQDRVDLPAEPATVAAYVDALAATHKASTIERRLVSISKAHRARGLDTPTADPLVKLASRAVRRRIGTAQEGKAPLLTNDVKAMVAHLPATRAGILLVSLQSGGRTRGAAGALRRGLPRTQ